MSKRIDLITVQLGDEFRVFQAPQFSHIKEGDEVTVETGIKDGAFQIAVGKAVKVHDWKQLDDEVVEQSMFLCRQSELPKITGRYEYHELKYEEETNA